MLIEVRECATPGRSARTAAVHDLLDIAEIPFVVDKSHGAIGLGIKRWPGNQIILVARTGIGPESWVAIALLITSLAVEDIAKVYPLVV